MRSLLFTVPLSAYVYEALFLMYTMCSCACVYLYLHKHNKCLHVTTKMWVKVCVLAALSFGCTDIVFTVISRVTQNKEDIGVFEVVATGRREGGE